MKERCEECEKLLNYDEIAEDMTICNKCYKELSKMART